jgi:3-dehydroquinate dehydratase-1
MEKTKGEVCQKASLLLSQEIDLVEWRMDGFTGWKEWECVHEVLLQLREILGEIPLLATFRSKQEGGCDEILREEYLSLCEKLISSGCIDLLDLESVLIGDAGRRMVEVAKEQGVICLFSYHDFTRMPSQEEMQVRLEQMCGQGAEMVKLAAMPASRSEVLAMMQGTLQFQDSHPEIPIITMAMSQDGVLSRIVGEFSGSAMTFGMVGEASAPGQVPVGDLKALLEGFHRILG